MNEMRIYVASLSDYNDGRLEGKWFDLADYSNASELMEAIQEMLDDLTKKYNDGEVREEWAVHDYEGIPSTLASEYMGEQDFQQLYDIAEVADDRGIPVEVLVERAGDTGSDDYQALADSLMFVVDGNDESDIVSEYEDQLGGLGNEFWSNHIYIDDVTERVMYGEDVDRFREDILYENPDMDENEAERQAEEMADEEAERREDLTTYLEDMGYGDEIPSFVSKDYEGAWKRSLSYDLDVIHHDGEMYVFSNNYGIGGTILSGMVGAYIGYKIGRARPQKIGFGTEIRIGNSVKDKIKSKIAKRRASKKKKFEGGGAVAKYPNDLPKAEAERLFHLAHKNAKVGDRLWNNFKRTPLSLIYSNLDNRGIKYAKGGGIGFKALSAKVAKRYEGKKPEAKYRAEYGKRYSKNEAKEVGDKVAGKVYWAQKNKMALGGKTPIAFKGYTINFINGEYRAEAYGNPQFSNKNLAKLKQEINAYLRGGKYAKGGNVNTGRSWHQDRRMHNKSESYEKPMNSRKRMFEDGGVIGQEIVFDDNGEENTGVIKDIHEITGNYIVTTDDGRVVALQNDIDVISLGRMREKPKSENKKRFGFFEDGGGVDYPNHYLEVEDLNQKINALTQQIEADYRNNEIDNYTDRNERELVRLKERLDWLMWGKDSYSQGGGISGLNDLIRG